MSPCPKLLLTQAEYDGELDAAQTIAQAEHRAGCAECQAAYRFLARVHGVMSEDGLRQRAPDALRAKLSAAARPATTVINVSWWRRPATNFAFGSAAAAAVAVLVLWPQQQTLLDQVVDDHIRALQPGHLEDVLSTDKHTVKPWFDGRIDFAPPVKDLAADQFPLKGGRLDYLGGHAAAAMVYEHGKHVIDLYVWPQASADSTPAAASRDGYNTLRWSQGGMAVWAVSDLEADQLAQFANLWRNAP